MLTCIFVHRGETCRKRQRSTSCYTRPYRERVSTYRSQANRLAVFVWRDDMFNYAWPIALVVLSNTLYQICAKSLPADIHPLASATVTYLVAALTTFVLYHVIVRDGNYLREFGHINWSAFALGVVVVGLEVGMLYAYRVGWPVSAATVVQAGFLAVSLLFVGALLYHEPITATKLIGMALCLAGLYFLNR